MLVSQREEAESKYGDGEDNAEEDLYNLLRGHTSLMITEDSSDSEEESKGQDQDNEDEHVVSSSWAPEMGASSVEPDGSRFKEGFLPKWGNLPINDPRDQEFAREWTNRSEAYSRRSRDERIKMRGSPPPKFHEDNFFTEGCSRTKSKSKSTFKLKGESDIWDDRQEEKYLGNTVEEYTNGRLKPSKYSDEGNSCERKLEKRKNEMIPPPYESKKKI